jgi:hypothetical protein
MRRRVSKNKTDLNVMYDDIERERERERFNYSLLDIICRIYYTLNPKVISGDWGECK